jgi:hypothetical protein
MTQNTNTDPLAGLGSSPPATTTGEQDRYAALGKQATLAFWRDLPQLLRERPGQWVAYHGDRQLGFGATRWELWQECLRRGLVPDEFVVRSIEPEDPSLILEGTEID